MPPERTFLGQSQKLSHTTESPWEQAARVENSRTCGVRARCLLVTGPERTVSAAWYQANHDGS
jgi:hypothetical protein